MIPSQIETKNQDQNQTVGYQLLHISGTMLGPAQRAHGTLKKLGV